MPACKRTAHVGWAARRGAAATLSGPGCRHHWPVNLEPAKEPEICCEPPRESRYDQAKYPKEAFKSDNPFQKSRELTDPNPITPVRGPMGAGGPGMGGAPGMAPGPGKY